MNIGYNKYNNEVTISLDGLTHTIKGNVAQFIADEINRLVPHECIKPDCEASDKFGGMFAITNIADAAQLIQMLNEENQNLKVDKKELHNTLEQVLRRLNRPSPNISQCDIDERLGTIASNQMMMWFLHFVSVIVSVVIFIIIASER